MRWFWKHRRPEIWETADDGPVGDIEAAHRIRDICAAAGPCADVAASGERISRKKRSFETERFNAAKKRALEIAMRMSDDSMRDVSVSQIVNLCVKANDLKTAKILLRAIQAQATKAELVADNPALADQEAAS